MKNQKTKKNSRRRWHLVEAGRLPLGRLAVKISKLLCGKDRVDFAPNLDQGGFVVVINAAGLKVTGKKAEDKTYYRYSGYPSGLKLKSFARLLKERPEEIIRHAVAGMLPRNRLAKRRLARLYIYGDANQPHGNQFSQV